MTRKEEILSQAKLITGLFSFRNGFQTPEDAYVLGAEWADAHPVNHWHKASEELPPVDTEVVCKMKGVPHTEHFVCKWDGKFWWHWGYFRQDAQGWFGLNEEWEVVEWKEI